MLRDHDQQDELEPVCDQFKLVQGNAEKRVHTLTDEPRVERQARCVEVLSEAFQNVLLVVKKEGPSPERAKMLNEEPAHGQRFVSRNECGLEHKKKGERPPHGDLEGPIPR